MNDPLSTYQLQFTYLIATVQQEAVMKVACYMTISQQVVVWFTNAGTLTGHILGWLAKLDAS